MPCQALPVDPSIISVAGAGRCRGKGIPATAGIPAAERLRDASQVSGRRGLWRAAARIERGGPGRPAAGLRLARQR